GRRGLHRRAVRGRACRRARERRRAMSAHPFGKVSGADAPATSLDQAIALVRVLLESLPKRERGVDFYHGAALERRRARLALAGAIIAPAQDGGTSLTFGGVTGTGPKLDGAMRAWLDAAAQAAVEGLPDRSPDQELLSI